MTMTCSTMFCCPPELPLHSCTCLLCRHISVHLSGGSPFPSRFPPHLYSLCTGQLVLDHTAVWGHTLPHRCCPTLHHARCYTRLDAHLFTILHTTTVNGVTTHIRFLSFHLRTRLSIHLPPPLDLWFVHTPRISTHLVYFHTTGSHSSLCVQHVAHHYTTTHTGSATLLLPILSYCTCLCSIYFGVPTV